MYFLAARVVYLFMNVKKANTTTTTDMITLCDKCKKNEVQIYNDNGDCCISCWYDMTDPKVS